MAKKKKKTHESPRRSTRRWLAVGGLAVVLLIGLALIVLASADIAQAPDSATDTLGPLFLDPRLSITLAYPYRGENGMVSATIAPDDYMPDDIKSDFEATQGVQTCEVAYVTPGTIGHVQADCRVDDGYNVIGMAELLRLLANRYYFGIRLDLTLSDSTTRTVYLWDTDGQTWAVTPPD
ncbi:MAG: hypothetical protein JW966_02005 [Anaerolineae bacterium]|nr:hypothetical protein [Anaerolineae bacterium]